MGKTVLTALLAAVCATAAAWAQDTRPATQPAANPELAAQFLSIGRAAAQKRDWAKAASALRLAVRYDESLLEGHYLLGKAHQALGRTREAAESYRRVVRLTAGRADLAGEPARWRADAEAQLTRVCVYLRQWEALCADFAGRFRELSAGKGGMPSCVRALEVAAALKGDDETISRELAIARKLLPAVLPPPAAEPDPQAAGLLIQRSAALAKSGKPDQAPPLLRSACGLSGDPATLAAAAEAFLSCSRPAEAAVVAEAAREALDAADAAQQRKLGPRLANVTRRADPDAARVAKLLTGFAGRGEGLARTAMAGRDLETAEEILALVLKLLPGRRSALKMMSKITDAAPSLSRLPNLASKWVKCSSYQGRAACGARAVELVVTPPKQESVYYASATLDFEPLRWGRSIRACWRIERVKGSPGQLGCAFWPLAGRAHAGAGYRSWFVVNIPKGVRAVRVADTKARAQLYGDQMAYDVAFEKDGGKLTVTVDGELLAEFELTGRELREAAGKPVVFRFHSAWDKGRGGKIRATLQEFTFSPDCLRRR